MKKRLSDDNEKEIMYLEIEKSKINREKAAIILNKSLMLYFIFMFVAIIGFVNQYLDRFLMNSLIVIGIFLLFVGAIPYFIIVNKEEKKIDSYIAILNGGK